MANVKISALPTASTPLAGTELVPIVQSGITSQTTVDAFNYFKQNSTGAVATTVQIKLQETVSVKDFGAVGDGTTDDTTAFYNALLAIKNAGGGILVIPPSSTSYALKQANIIDVDFTGLFIEIKGGGAILDCTSVVPSTSGQIIKLTGGAGTNIILHDFEMNGQYTDALGSLSGIRITGCDHLDVDNLIMDGFGYVNLYVSDAAGFDPPAVNINGKITNSIFNRGAYANCMVSGNSVLVQGNRFYTAGRPSTGVANGYGIVVAGYYNTVQSNTSEYNYRYGIDVRNTNNVTVCGNYLYANKFVGIYGVNENSIKKFSSAYIADNEINMAALSSTYGMWLGMYATSGTQEVREIFIRNNIVRNCRDNYGILISCDTNGTADLDRLIIEGNALYENTTVSSGIRLDNSTTGKVQDVIVCNNILRNSGFYEFYNAKNIKVNNNILRIDNSTALTYGIYIGEQFGSGDFADVFDNVLTSNAAITTPVSVTAYTKYSAERNYFNGSTIQPKANVFSVISTNDNTGEIKFGFATAGATASLDIANILLPDADDSAYVVLNLTSARYANNGKADYILRIAARNNAGTLSISAATVTTNNYEGAMTAPTIALTATGTTAKLTLTINNTYTSSYGVANISTYSGAIAVI